MNLIINAVQQNKSIQPKPASKPIVHNNTLQSDTFEKSDKNTEADIFYISDLHCKMTNMERICAISKQFDAMKSNGVKLKLASGDILLGSNPMTNKVANNFLNWIGVIANALGNHELDATPNALAASISDAKYNLLAANVTVKSDSPMAGKIQKSMI